MLNKEDLSDALAEFASEAAVMSRLLTRNNNQHRKSKPHILLRTVSRYVAAINEQSEDILSINKDAERLLRTHHKLGGSAVKESAQCMLGLHKVVALSVQAIIWIEKAAKETGGYIAQMVFLPLYTVYLALGARLHALASSLAKHHHRRLDALRCSLTVREESGAPVACTAAIVFPQHNEAISSALAAYALPPSVVDVINSLAGPGSCPGCNWASAGAGASVGADAGAAACAAVGTETRGAALAVRGAGSVAPSSADRSISAAPLGAQGGGGGGDDDIGEDIGCGDVVEGSESVRRSSSIGASDGKGELHHRTSLVVSTPAPGIPTGKSSGSQDGDSGVEDRDREIRSVTAGRDFAASTTPLSKSKDTATSTSSSTSKKSEAASTSQRILTAPPKSARKADRAASRGSEKLKKRRKSEGGGTGAGDDIDDIFGSLPC